MSAPPGEDTATGDRDGPPGDGGAGPDPAPRRFRIEPFRDYLGFERGLSGRTVDAYARDCRQLAVFARERGVPRPAGIDYRLLRDFVAELADRGLAGSTVSRKISAIRSYFGFLLDEGVVDEDPTERLEAPRPVRALPDVLSVPEVERLLGAVPAEAELAFRDRAILEVLYGAGLRVSELTDLRLRNLLLDEGLLQVTGKGSKERLVPVGAGARRALARYLRELRRRLDRGEGEGRVFLNHHGRPLSRVGVWKIVKRHVRRAGLERRVTPHTLRHTFATHLLEGGADLASVQEMLGHADISTTEIYTHVDRSWLREVHRSCHPRG